MDDKEEHAPLPWEAVLSKDPVRDHTHYIVSERGVVGYWKGGKQNHEDNHWVLTEADVEFIVTACNSHDALVKILGDLYEKIVADQPITMKDVQPARNMLHNLQKKGRA